MYVLRLRGRHHPGGCSGDTDGVDVGVTIWICAGTALFEQVCCCSEGLMGNGGRLEEKSGV